MSKIELKYYFNISESKSKKLQNNVHEILIKRKYHMRIADARKSDRLRQFNLLHVCFSAIWTHY